MAACEVESSGASRLLVGALAAGPGTSGQVSVLDLSTAQFTQQVHQAPPRQAVSLNVHNRLKIAERLGHQAATSYSPWYSHTSVLVSHYMCRSLASMI